MQNRYLKMRTRPNKIDLKHLDDYIEDRDIGWLEDSDLLTNSLLKNNHASTKHKSEFSVISTKSQQSSHDCDLDDYNHLQPANDSKYGLKM